MGDYEFIRDRLKEITSTVERIEEKVTSIEVTLAGNYISKAECTVCKTENNTDKRLFTGWLIGVYAVGISSLLAGIGLIISRWF